MTKRNKSNPIGKCSPLSVRLTREERHALSQAAGDMSLSDYVRTKLFGEIKANEHTSPIRLSSLERQKLLAQILSELGKSNIGNSLRDISLSAKIGALPLSQDVLEEINAAIQHVIAIRKLLLSALGLKRGGRS